MKTLRKIATLLLASALVFALCFSMVACGGSATAVGSYHYERIVPSEYGARIQRGVQQNLTLYDDGTYALSTITLTWRTADYDSGAEFVAYSQYIVNVYGTYEVVAETEGDEADNATRTVRLGDVTRVDVGGQYAEAGLEGMDYLGDSNTFDADKQAKALAYYNIKAGDVTIDLVLYRLNQAVSLNTPTGLVETNGTISMFV